MDVGRSSLLPGRRQHDLADAHPLRLPASLLAGEPAVRSGLNLPLPVRCIGLCHSAQALEHPAVRGLYDFLRAA